MEIKLRETARNQTTKANRSSAEEWRTVSSGLGLWAFLRYQTDTMAFCRHRKHSTKYRICLNFIHGEYLTWKYTVMFNIDWALIIHKTQSQILPASNIMFTVQSCLYSYARLFAREKLILGETINRITGFPNRRWQLGLGLAGKWEVVEMREER